MANWKAASIATIVISAFLLSVSFATCLADCTSSEPDILVADRGGDGIEVKAGSVSTFDIILTNNAAYDDTSVAEDIIVTMTAAVTDGNGKKASSIASNVSIKGSSEDYVILSGQDIAVFTITVEPDRYSENGDFTLSYTYSAFDLKNTALGDPVTATKKLTVIPYIDNEGYYNKYLGIFPNESDGIIGESWFTALVTLVVIVGLGTAASFAAAPAISILMVNKDDPDRKPLRRSLLRMFILLSVVFGISRSMAVYGISGKDYDAIDDAFLLIYALISAFIIWKLYTAFLDRISDNIQKHGSQDALENYHSFKPLFLYLGKIILALVTIFSIMGTLGIDMAAIITSAGLITLGITFGAQQILSQFFAGLLILTTRPFKKGDLIQLGTDLVYKVRKVKVMNTELENWDNSDITIVPNNTLTSSNIKNLTRDTLMTKLYIFIGVGYGTNLDQARGLMVEAANEHPHVIKDGSAPAPSTSLMDFQDSNIQLRLNIWIDDFNLIIKVGSDLRNAMFEKFNAAGVSIDYNQIVVHYADKE